MDWRSPTTWVFFGMVAVVALFVVVGAADNDETVSSPSSPAASSEGRYLEFMRDNVTGAANRSDSQLIAGGKELCRTLDDVESQSQLAVIAEVLEYDVDEFASAMIAAVNTYCPEHDDLIG